MSRSKGGEQLPVGPRGKAASDGSSAQAAPVNAVQPRGPRPDPRIAQTKSLVLAATLDLIADVGFEGATVERIAERSGVARSTIYRHWPDPSRLYLQAFEPSSQAALPPRTGKVREDLLVFTNHVAMRLNDPVFLGALVSQMDKGRRDHEYRHQHLEYARERNAHGRSILEDGIRDGLVRPDIDVDYEISTILGGLLFRRVFRYEAITPELVDRLVNDVCDRVRVRGGRDRRPQLARG